MNDNRLFNVGTRYLLPGASRYSALRILLSINPGLTKKSINEHVPDQDRYVRENNLRWFGSEIAERVHLYVESNKSPRKQCPQCALLLFHSPLFDMSWVTHCPMHRCELVTSCQLCGRFFPAAGGPYHPCDACGIASFERLVSIQEACRNFNSTRFFECYAWIFQALEASTNNIRTSSWFDTFAHFEWRQPSVFDSDWYLFHRYNMPPQCLDAQIIEAPSISTRTCNLMRTEDSTHKGSLKGSTLFADSLVELLPVDYRVARKVILWIRKMAGPSHRLTLAAYHRTNSELLECLPKSCAFCMAFSLWFQSVAESKYALQLWSNRHRSLLDYYECPWSEFVPELYPAKIVVNHDNGFRHTEPLFNYWLYEFSLIVAFKEILQKCITLQNNLPLQPYRSREWHSVNAFDLARTISFELVDKSLTCYFFSDAPRLPKTGYTEALTNDCSLFQLALARLNKFYLQNISWTINPQFTYNQFLTLHDVIRSQLPSTKYCRSAEMRQYREYLETHNNYGRSVPGLVDSTSNEK